MKDWQEHAACRDADPTIFFPEETLNPRDSLKQAREYCTVCPVFAECKVAGRRERNGVWAGVNRATRPKGKAA